jgi:hypothetical protein
VSCQRFDWKSKSKDFNLYENADDFTHFHPGIFERQWGLLIQTRCSPRRFFFGVDLQTISPGIYSHPDFSTINRL